MSLGPYGAMAHRKYRCHALGNGPMGGCRIRITRMRHDALHEGSGYGARITRQRCEVASYSRSTEPAVVIVTSAPVGEAKRVATAAPGF